MKAFLTALAIAACALPLRAQTDATVEAERARIAVERTQANARLATQEAACYQTFAVNDCLNTARSQRRDLLSDLRRQELTLNEAGRKRRAADRVRSIEQRNSAQQQEDTAARRTEAELRQGEKQQVLAERAAERARSAASKPLRAARTPKEARVGRTSDRTARDKKSHDPADDLRRSQQRQQEAKKRLERVTSRQAEAAKKGVKPLPVPP